jgi:hypothetical protein
VEGVKEAKMLMVMVIVNQVLHRMKVVNDSSRDLKVQEDIPLLQHSLLSPLLQLRVN